jgi:hypothetical protein
MEGVWGGLSRSVTRRLAFSCFSGVVLEAPDLVGDEDHGQYSDHNEDPGQPRNVGGL